MKVIPCEIGTFVSYARVDGTCRMVENTRHAWNKEGICMNCDKSRKEVRRKAGGQKCKSKP